jgi:manganese efflux pump family protein
MDLLTPLLLGIGLSMDCFAVSLAIGTTTKTRLFYAAAIIALCFGIFQAGMTVMGWFAGASLIDLIAGFDHWVAFILLSVIGVKMIWEGFKCGEEESQLEVIRIIPVFILSVATSIDALAVGVTFGVLGTEILIPSLVIGIVAFALSFAGVMLGERLEEFVGNKIEIAGGIILILIGIKVLTEHLFT